MQKLFSDSDLEQIAALGLSIADVEHQIENFKKGFPKINLIAPATPANGGICVLSDDDISKYITRYQNTKDKLNILKFVPASGAATRMFKDLYSFSSTYFGIAKNFEKEFPEVQKFLENIRSFAFFNDLKECMEKSSLDLQDYMDRGDYTTIINYLLKEQYLNYGGLPKGLLKFHKYDDAQRTPLEEHIVEGAEYANSNGTVNIHFTVSPEHKSLFKKKVNAVKSYYEELYKIKLHITYSEQHHYTDIIAVDEYNNPMRDENEKLIFRPGGHGALIENLNDCKADLIFIKNIDNVVPDWMKHTTIVYKQALAGLLLDVQKKVFRYLKTIDNNPTQRQLSYIANFAQKTLGLYIPSDFKTKSLQSQRKALKALLNRPIRVCGMVKNQGEPGGGPFFIQNSEGERSLQIVETAQINRKDPNQESILNQSTHFNPVDLICSTKNYKGQAFNLRNYIDPTTGFISKKTKGAQTMKSQELPGLWNGAMANWITLFVEVPLATFNPVKSVTDLLRKEHSSDL